MAEAAIPIDEYSIKLTLLRLYAGVEKAHRINVIGRRFQSGNLEFEMKRKFSDTERERAGRAVTQLVADGLLTPTYADIADPEGWLMITEAGREAVRRGALDELDNALLALDPRFVAMRYGAWSASASSTDDAARQATRRPICPA